MAARLSISSAADGAVIATIQSDSDGHFVVKVPPGSYLLRPLALANGPARDSTPMSVTVEPGHYTTVTVLFDSGLR